MRSIHAYSKFNCSRQTQNVDNKTFKISCYAETCTRIVLEVKGINFKYLISDSSSGCRSLQIWRHESCTDCHRPISQHILLCHQMRRVHKRGHWRSHLKHIPIDWNLCRQVEQLSSKETRKGRSLKMETFNLINNFRFICVLTTIVSVGFLPWDNFSLDWISARMEAWARSLQVKCFTSISLPVKNVSISN